MSDYCTGCGRPLSNVVGKSVNDDGHEEGCTLERIANALEDLVKQGGSS